MEYDLFLRKLDVHMTLDERKCHLPGNNIGIDFYGHRHWFFFQIYGVR